METRTREAIRYLGYGKHAVDDKTLALINNSFAELEQVAVKRIIYRIFDVSLRRKAELKIGALEIESKALHKNMAGCEQAIILGATLGIEVDMLMKRYSLTDMSKVIVLQACAAAMLEEYLDDWQKGIRQALLKEDKYLRPRFSPGYGDFSIEHQDMILRMLDTAKIIGLTMTESYMLTPTKSVTAVAGISGTEENCHKHGCEVCEKTDCTYRRNQT